MQGNRIQSPEEYSLGRRIDRNLLNGFYRRKDIVPQTFHSFLVVGGESSDIGDVTGDSLFRPVA
jgi:hypothetical protein